MPETRIQGGALIEIPSRAENRADVHATMDARERELAKTIKWLDITIPPPSPAAASLITPGPDQGFIWSVRMASVNLASAGTLIAYKVSSGYSSIATTQTDTRRPVGYASTSQTPQVITWTSQLILQAGWALLLVGGQNISNAYLGVWEVESERQWVFS